MSAVTTADREIVLSRVFDAPREVVFKAWTDPNLVAQWWGPNGFRTTTHEMDVRPGGVWRFIMHGPDGTDYPNKIVYQEVVKPQRLVYQHSDDTGDEGGQFHVTVTFEDDAGKTKLTMRSLFASAAERDRVVEEFGAIEGGKQTLQRLADYLAGTADPPREVNITRVFDAPRSVVFKTFTDSKQMAQWWGPRQFTNPVCELDPRPGGVIRIDMRGPDGTVYPNRGAFREIVEPERIVFTLALQDKDGKTLIDTLNTVTLVDDGGKTRLQLNARVVGFAPEAAGFLAGMEAGWTESLDRLDEHVSESVATKE